jgi:hypothetical protein
MDAPSRCGDCAPRQERHWGKDPQVPGVTA